MGFYAGMKTRLTPSQKKKSRVSLEASGASLVIRDVTKSDQAEYRCTVHFKMSPSITHRLQLVVTGNIYKSGFI